MYRILFGCDDRILLFFYILKYFDRNIQIQFNLVEFFSIVYGIIIITILQIYYILLSQLCKRKMKNYNII